MDVIRINDFRFMMHNFQPIELSFEIFKITV